MSNVAVWAVHLFTASGAALAFLAAVATTHAHWQLVFIYLGAALIIDGVDGTIARGMRVSSRLPWFDGAALDFVVDYATYVFVPALIIADGGLMAEPLATIAGIVVAIIGALYFADKRMKTMDHGFRGFPAIWNTIAFLLMVYRPPEAITVIAIALCAILTFSPVEWIHPIRVARLRPLTIAMTVAWAILAIITVLDDLHPTLPVLILLGVVSLYLGLIGAVLQIARRQRF